MNYFGNGGHIIYVRHYSIIYRTIVCNPLGTTCTGLSHSTTMFALLMKRWREQQMATKQYWDLMLACDSTKSSLRYHYNLYESPTWTACRSRMHRSLTSSNGHRLESMSRWARTSFRSLLEGLPTPVGEWADDFIGPIASTFLMTSWQMFSMASDLELASLLPRPSHLPRDSWSWTSIFWRRINVCSVLQQATQ